MITIRQNLKLLGGGVPPVIRVTQGDTAVTLLLTLYSGNSPFAKPSGAEALIECTKPDSKAVKADAVYNEDGTVSITLTEQMTCVTGEVYCKVGIRETDGKVSTAALILNVEPSGVTDGAVISESDVPDIRKAIEAADSAKQYVAEAVESAANAKTSESKAKTYASNASKSASSAKTSASNAKTSETNAASSNTAAATSASNAKTSETNAKGYLDKMTSYIAAGSTITFDEEKGDIIVTIGG